MNSLEASRGSRHRLRGGRMLRRERGEKGGVRFQRERRRGREKALGLVLGDERCNPRNGGRAGGSDLQTSARQTLIW